MKTYNIHQAKTHLSRLLEAVAERGEEIVIAKAGKPLAKLVPLSTGGKSRSLGSLAGQVRESPHWWGPDPEIEALFYGQTSQSKPKKVAEGKRPR